MKQSYLPGGCSFAAPQPRTCAVQTRALGTGTSDSVVYPSAVKYAIKQTLNISIPKTPLTFCHVSHCTTICKSGHCIGNETYSVYSLKTNLVIAHYELCTIISKKKIDRWYFVEFIVRWNIISIQWYFVEFVVRWNIISIEWSEKIIFTSGATMSEHFFSRIKKWKIFQNSMIPCYNEFNKFSVLFYESLSVYESLCRAPNLRN